jgi:hypothetical protein
MILASDGQLGGLIGVAWHAVATARGTGAESLPQRPPSHRCIHAWSGKVPQRLRSLRNVKKPLRVWRPET